MSRTQHRPTGTSVCVWHIYAFIRPCEDSRKVELRFAVVYLKICCASRVLPKVTQQDLGTGKAWGVSVVASFKEASMSKIGSAGAITL